MGRPLRVLLLTETFHPEIGGGEGQARLLASALAQRGHGVTIVTRRSRRELPPDRVEDGIRVVRIGPAGAGRWKKWGLALSGLRPLARLGGEAHVIFVSGFRILGMPAVFAARRMGRVCVLKADSPGELSGEFFRAGLARLHLEPGSAAVRTLVGWRNALLRRADAFVAISGEIAEELTAHGVRPDRVHRIPNGVDTRRFRPADEGEREALRRRLGLPAGRLAVYTGRLVSYKGLPLLLEVWRALREGGTEATLVLVGAGGADMHGCEGQLRDTVQEHGLGGSVIFTGAVEEVELYLRAADVFVFPTEIEAFGVSLVEAMACGLPAVATRVGGIRDFLEDGRNGLVVDPSDFGQLRGALGRLLAGGEAAEALGRSARETVLRRFSADAVAEGYLRLFETLLGVPAAEPAP